MDKKNKELLKNIFFLAIGVLGTKFIQFLLLPYYTRVFSPYEYGCIELVITFVSLFVPIITLQLPDAIMRMGLSKEITLNLLVSNTFIVLICSSLTAVILYPVMYFIETFRDFRVYILLLVIFQIYRNNLVILLKVTDRVNMYSLESTFNAFFMSLLCVFMINYLNMGIKSIFLAEICTNFISIIAIIWLGNFYKNIRLNTYKNIEFIVEMLKYSAPLTLNAISWWVITFSSRFVLNFYYNTSDVGIYSVASKIPAVLTTLIAVFTQAWVISAIKEYENNKNYNFYLNIYKIYTTVLFLITGVLIFIIKPLMMLYVHDSFIESWVYVPLLLVGVLYLGISNYYGAIYSAAKLNILEVKTTILCGLINLSFNFLLIPFLGIIGAVYSTIIAYFTITVIRNYYLKMKLGIIINISDLIICGVLLLLESLFIIAENLLLAFSVFSVLIFYNIYRWKKYEIYNL